MKKTIHTLLLLFTMLLVWTSAWAVTIDRKDWLQPADLTGLSWNELDTMFNADGTWNGINVTNLDDAYFNGVIWASRDEVIAMFESALSITITPDELYTQADSDWAPLFTSESMFNTTGNPFPEDDNLVYVWAWTRGSYHTIYGVDQAFAPYIYDNTCETSEDLINPRYSYPVGTFDEALGAWLYKDITSTDPHHSTPEPTTLILLGTGLISFAGLSRKRYFNKA